MECGTGNKEYGMGQLRIRIEGELGTWKLGNGSCKPGKRGKRGKEGERRDKRGMEWKQGKGEKGETGER